jgi:hypothetical protein
MYAKISPQNKNRQIHSWNESALLTHCIWQQHWFVQYVLYRSNKYIRWQVQVRLALYLECQYQWALWQNMFAAPNNKGFK